MFLVLRNLMNEDFEKLLIFSAFYFIIFIFYFVLFSPLLSSCRYSFYTSASCFNFPTHFCSHGQKTKEG